MLFSLLEWDFELTFGKKKEGKDPTHVVCANPIPFDLGPSEKIDKELEMLDS